MTKTSETGKGAENDSKEWIDKVVADSFNELLVSISSDGKLHPSEQANRVKVLADHSNMKIYDFINSYHAYCKLCEQHFYCRTLASDVNSFFQKHLNTSYHRQIRAVYTPSDAIPIFSWEEKFDSARCNLCEMSNINSYILDTEFDIKKLMKLHLCFWDQENRDTNERLLKKFNLLKKYCGLKIFREKYIKTINGKEVCLLCMTELPWSGEKAYCHLSSDSHYHNFCAFLRVCFSFLPKDVLNGFHLEMITRSLITCDLPVVEKFKDSDERKICLQYSNGLENPYSEEQGNFSFSPKAVEKLFAEENDFIHKNGCLLCNKVFEPGHMSSELHQSKADTIEEKSFDVSEKYFTFLLNRGKRLRMIEKYDRLKTGLENPPLPITPKKSTKQPHSQENYFKNLLEKKMKSVNTIFKVGVTGEVFCQMCDQFIDYNSEILHLTSHYHKTQEDKWNEIRAHMNNERFIEPFQRIKNIIVCLVCGAFFDPNSLFSHLKGGTHSRRFEWYCNQNVSTPISVAISFTKEFMCFCTVCNTPLSKRASFLSLKTTLKNICRHWPCQKKKEKPDLFDELKMIFETNKSAVRKNLNLEQEMSFPCSTCGRPFKEAEMKTHSETCAKNSVDFKKVENTVECVLNVFEKKIMNNVLDRSATLLGGLSKLNIDPTKNEVKKSTEPEESSPELEDPKERASINGPESEQSSDNQVKEKCIKILKNELRSQKTDNNNVKNKVQLVKSVEKINLEEEHEVLVIEGLPKSQRRCDVIYRKFNPFGKIRYVFFSQKKTIVAFEEGNIREIAAKTPNLFKNQVISLTISARKDADHTAEKPPVLNRELVSLFQDPATLMDFSLKLIMQAVSATESPLERKREELVCSTIISAIAEKFPFGRCYPFGSRLSGLTLSNSDLDVFLDCGGMYEGFKYTTPCSERKLVNKVATLLRKKEEISHIVVVDRARVPIVSFLHKPTLMHCDLSFKNGLSVQNTLLIKFMVSLDWRVRPLILFLKHWAKLNGIHGPPYFSSYAIAMLVIYYLEQLECPVLPTIESLQSSYVGRRTTIAVDDLKHGSLFSLLYSPLCYSHPLITLISASDDTGPDEEFLTYYGSNMNFRILVFTCTSWDCSINVNQSSVPKSENKEPFPKLLAELFQFYSIFDYETNVISPLTGKLLPRNAFSKSGIENLPMCYKRNILNLPSPIENLVNSKIHICIIDPFDLSHVLTKSFTSRALSLFTQLCRISARILKKAIMDSELEQE